MSPRWLCLVICVACGSPQSTSDEPQTAREKQMLEAQASGDHVRSSSKYGNWRYQGDRKACFYVQGRQCYRTENAACQAAHCKMPKKCTVVGAGPAQMTCK